MAWQLGELFVQFSAKGVDVARKAIHSIQADLAAWIRLGLTATAEGNRLALSQQLLGETIASLFLPAIHAASDAFFQFRDALAGSEAAAKFQSLVGQLADLFQQVLPIAIDAVIKSLDVFVDIIDEIVADVGALLDLMQPLI